MKRMLFCAALCVTFSGCANSPELPPKRDVITEFRVERVEVPVRVPCMEAKDIPAKPVFAPVDVKVADTKQLAAAISAYVLELLQYVGAADIIMQRCVK
jgi:hypothetical protein